MDFAHIFSSISESLCDEQKAKEPPSECILMKRSTILPFMSFAFNAHCARVSKHTPWCYGVQLMFFRHMGLMLEYFQEWKKTKDT